MPQIKSGVKGFAPATSPPEPRTRLPTWWRIVPLARNMESDLVVQWLRKYEAATSFFNSVWSTIISAEIVLAGGVLITDSLRNLGSPDMNVGQESHISGPACSLAVSNKRPNTD